MNDKKMDDTTTIKKIKEAVAAFVAERDWEKFHSPKNMSMDIAAEAAELMEFFMWVEGKESYEIVNEKRKEVEDEVADIFMGLICFCNTSNIDLSCAFERKLALTKKNYPVEKAKGSCKKYTDYK